MLLSSWKLGLVTIQASPLAESAWTVQLPDYYRPLTLQLPWVLHVAAKGPPATLVVGYHRLKYGALVAQSSDNKLCVCRCQQAHTHVLSCFIGLAALSCPQELKQLHAPRHLKSAQDACKLLHQLEVATGSRAIWGLLYSGHLNRCQQPQLIELGTPGSTLELAVLSKGTICALYEDQQKMAEQSA
eukprot:COSAG01_NODE_28588_length_657_cov_2.129032_1_plen_186_part_00